MMGSRKSNAMPHAYTKDQLVEPPVIGLFAKLGGITVPLSALKETLVISKSFEPK